MAHDVFMSYSPKDKVVADAVCATLEARRVRCWIAPRDILPGVPYAEALIDALGAAPSSRIVASPRSASRDAGPRVWPDGLLEELFMTSEQPVVRDLFLLAKEVNFHGQIQWRGRKSNASFTSSCRPATRTGRSAPASSRATISTRPSCGLPQLAARAHPAG